MITLALTAFAALLGLLLVRLPIGLSLLAVGAAGIAFIRPQAVLPTISGELITISTNYALTIIPLFILMGNLAGKSGMSRDLFDAAQSFIGHKRSGLASATIIGSAGFSALSGSSLAATLTMGTVALPQMRRFGYHDGLSTGAIAAGGTLGILIPPSAGMIIYATLTETSVGRLFIAGILPGLLLSTLFVLAIFLIVRHDPAKAPKQPAPAPWAACVAAFATFASCLLGLSLHGLELFELLHLHAREGRIRRH
jgi:tripartite ATP-independent transporter DctM subunit